MRDLVRSALFIGAATLFAGCGGSQQIGQTASPQLQGDSVSTPLPDGAVSHRASRPLPRYPQTSQPLLYVGDDGVGAIDIFPLTGPNQQQIGSISKGVDYPWGLSVDANNSLYVANGGSSTVTVYPYGSTRPSMKYSHLGLALYALPDSTGHVFVSGYNRHHVGHVLELSAGRNHVIAHVQLGTEADGMAEDGQGNLYVAYRGDGRFHRSSIAEFAPGLKHKRHLRMTIDEPQGLLVDSGGNIVVVESVADRIDVFPPGATTPSVTVTIAGIGNLAELAMQNSETTLWVSSEGGLVYSMPYPLTSSTVPTEYEQIPSEDSNGVAVSP
jgi:NHL repeat